MEKEDGNAGPEAAKEPLPYNPKDSIGSEPTAVPVADIQPGDSPREIVCDEEHVLSIMTSPVDRIPPILIHRPTMTIVDGFHRFTAAKRRDATLILAIFVDCSLEEAYAHAVRANVTHGKPLTLNERRQAAKHVLRGRPTLSDRMVGEICGLSPRTIASVRTDYSLGTGVTKRRGRDGRMRPVDRTAGQRRVGQAIESNPGASLRELAKIADVSPSTARAVKQKLRYKDSQFVTGVPSSADRCTTEEGNGDELAADSALHSSFEREALAKWLEGHTIRREDWTAFVSEVPISRIYVIADLAKRCSESWLEFSQALEDRASRAD